MLWCVSRYKSSLGGWKAGDGPINDPALEAALLRDSPLSFSPEPPARESAPLLESSALSGPPQDKMLHSPVVAKEPLLNPGAMDATTHAAIMPNPEHRGQGRGRGRGRG